MLQYIQRYSTFVINNLLVERLDGGEINSQFYPNKHIYNTMNNLKLTKKLAALASTAMLVTNILSAGIASAATNTASATLATGGKTVTAGTSATLTGTGVTIATTASTISGSVTGIAVSNLAGDGATWTVSSTMTQLGLAGTSMVKVNLNGSQATNLTITGNYNPVLADCSSTFTAAVATSTTADDVVPCGDMTIQPTTVVGGVPTVITKTPASGTAVTGIAVSSGSVTVDGLTLTFGGTSWATTNQIGIHTDIIPHILITATPGSLSATGGGAATTGVAAQSAAVYSGTTATSSSRADYVAETGAGYGSYTYAIALSAVTHGYALGGSYSGTLTLTIA